MKNRVPFPERVHFLILRLVTLGQLVLQMKTNPHLRQRNLGNPLHLHRLRDNLNSERYAALAPFQ